MLTDTHCHLASHQFSEEEMGELLERSRVVGVRRWVSLSTDLQDAVRNLEIAARHEGVGVGIGIHPCDVTEFLDEQWVEVERLARQPKVVCIGETGLDYFHAAPQGWTEEAYRGRQRAMLRRHFELAEALDLPLVMHTRDKQGADSFEDALELATEYAGRVACVFHCFLGPWELAERVWATGGKVSFTGIVTFKNASECLACAVKAAPGTFFLETDAPYLAPVPYRGKRCEPGMVMETARHLAAARGETLEAMAAHTEAAATAFFRWMRD